jgi:hypothetical protein
VMLVLMLRVNDIIFICMDQDYTWGDLKNQRREDPGRKRQEGEDEVGYGFSLAIGLDLVLSILKVLSWRNYNEQISSMLGDSLPLTAIKKRISEREKRRILSLRFSLRYRYISSTKYSLKYYYKGFNISKKFKFKLGTMNLHHSIAHLASSHSYIIHIHHSTSP